MFKSTELTYYKDNTCIVSIQDTDFIYTISTVHKDLFICVVAAILAYSERNLPVASNIALLYLFWSTSYFYNGHRINKWLLTDREQIETHYPNLQYKSKIYPCVIRQLKLLNFHKK